MDEHYSIQILFETVSYDINTILKNACHVHCLHIYNKEWDPFLGFLVKLFSNENKIILFY